jgi:hypothetical protein
MQVAGGESLRTNILPFVERPGGDPTDRFPPVVKEFDSIDGMMEFIQTEPILWPTNPDSQKRRQSPSEIEFDGTSTWEEACELAHHGWQEGRHLLIEASSEQPPAEYSKARATHYDVAGSYPDVSRFVAGDPFSMVDFALSERGRRKTLKIMVSPICDNTVTQERRAYWGAALLSWIEAEELAGYAIELEVIYVSAPSGYWLDDNKLGPLLVIKFSLKKPDEQLSVSELAFWLMHNAAHRRIQFAVRERLPIGKWYELDHVYGDAVTDPS